MNKEYYGCRLSFYRRLNFWLEFVIAIATSSIAGWAIWKTELGGVIWVAVAAMAAVLSVAKPFLGFSKKIERYSKLFTAYGDALFDLEMMNEYVQIRKKLTDSFHDKYNDILDRMRSLSADDDPKVSERLLGKCFDITNRRYPPESFWLPPQPA